MFWIIGTIAIVLLFTYSLCKVSADAEKRFDKIDRNACDRID